jgi:hypothetical protein
MYDHDDDQDMEMSETIEFPFSSVTEDSLVICGTRNSSTTIKIVKKAEHGSYRDAVVLEAFLSTSLPSQTVIMLAQLLYKRNIEPNLAGLDSDPDPMPSAPTAQKNPPKKPRTRKSKLFLDDSDSF